MNKEQVLVPQLRFPEFENDGDWEEKKLSDVSDIVTGTTPKTSESANYDGDKLFVSPADISETRYIDKTEKRLSEIGYSKSRVIPANSILFVCIGSTIGKIAQNKIECTTNQQINSLIPFENHSNDFIYSLLEVNSAIIASLAGHQAVPLINKTDFSEILVLLPLTKPEQQKIANCLSSLDTLITAQTEKLDHLKAHKKGLLQQLFLAKGETQPQLRFPEFKNDEDWNKTILGNIGKPLMCKRVFKKQTSSDSNNSIPFYKIGTFGKTADAYIPVNLYEKLKDKYSFPNVGDILISASGTIGRLVVYDGVDAYFQDSNIVWLGHNEEDVINSFLYYCYFTLNWQISDGGIIKRLYNNNLKEMIIYYPKKDEQQKIANCLSSLDTLITAQTEKLDHLKDHKKGLMQKLFPNVNDVEV